MSKHQGSFKNSEVEKLSSELKFISKIQPGQRIDVSSKTLQDNTYWTSASRTVQRLTTFNRKNIESREKIYKYIVDVVQDSLSMLESLSNSSNEYDLEICKNLISDLVNVRYGIENLQTTYKESEMYVSRLETLLQTDLDVKLRELCAKRGINYNDIVEAVSFRRQKEDESETEDETETEEADNNEADNNEADNNEADNNEEADNEAPELPPSPDKKKETIEDEEAILENPDPLPSPKTYRQVATSPTIRRSQNPFEVLSQLDRIRVKVKDEILKGDDDSSSQNNSRRKAKKRRNKNPSYQYDPHYFMNNDDSDVILKNTDLEKGLIS